MGTHLIKIYNSANIIYLYKRIYNLHYSDCAGYKPMSSLDEKSFLSSVSLLSRSSPPPVSPSWFMCIMCALWHTNNSLFQNILSGYFQHVFQYPCWSSFVTRHTKSCSNLEVHTHCDIFMRKSLNSGSCEFYTFRPHIWRQSNCMTMINQYAINFVDISLDFCKRITW